MNQETRARLIDVKVSDRHLRKKQVMSHLRTHLSRLVALVLAPVSVVARTVQGLVPEMVVCHEGESQTIRLDARSNPLDSGQCCGCLDCLTLIFDLPVVAGFAPDVQPLLPAQKWRLAADALELQRPLRLIARDPRFRMHTSIPHAAALEFGQERRGKAMQLTRQTTRVAR